MRFNQAKFKLASSGQAIVIGAMLVLLVLLASLQYYWLGQLSAGEQEQMKSHLQSVLASFNEDLDSELTRAYAAFSLITEEAGIEKGGTLTSYSTKYERWREQAAHPQLVKTLYVGLMNDQESLDLHVLNPASLMFEGSEWPSWMDRLRAQVKPPHQPDRQFGPPPGPPPPLLIEEPPALVIRLHATGPDSRIRLPGPPRLLGLAVVELDLSYIQQGLLPSLVKKHFVAGDGSSYEIKIVSRRDPQRVIFTSTPADDTNATISNRAVENTSADVTGFAFAPRREELRGPMRSSERGGFGPGDRPPPPGPRRPPPSSMSGGNGPRGPGQSQPGLWQVEIRHREGSLAAAVTRARRRNLLVSFGILALLAASAFFVIASARQARRLARQQMDFVAGVSHELRTPLAVIESAAYNLDKGVVKTREQTQTYGALIRKESFRLKEMVEQMLEFAGAQAGRSQYNLRLTSPNHILDDVLSISQPLLAERNFQLESDIAADLPQVSADGPALARAILNLLNNAMKYSGENRWIGLQAHQVEDGNNRIVRIQVEDHGIGIPGDELKHVFEPFYRGAAARAAQIHGNGLGLSLVKQIVTAHGGRIAAQSSRDGGTVIEIDLPVASQSVDVSQKVSDAVDELRYEQAHPSSRR